MRVLVCSIDFQPREGGISTFAYEVSQSLKKQGNEVVVLAPQTEGQEAFDKTCPLEIVRTDFQVIALKKDISGLRHEAHCLRSSLRLMRRIIKERKIDSILCFHWRIFGPIGLLISKFSRVKFFLVGHGLELAPYRDRPVKGQPWNIALSNLLHNAVLKAEFFVRGANFRGAKAVFVPSEFTKKMILDLGVKDERIFVTNCGVDIQKFNPDRGCNGVRSGYGIEGKKVILSLGRLIRRKGVDMALQAMPRVLESVEDAVYLIVGQGEYERQLRRIAAKQKLNGQVIFAGYVPDYRIPDFYNACDLFLMPARECPGGDVEGFGIVFLEANACGKPVIGGRSGGVTEAVVDETSGLLVDPRSKDELSGAIIRLLTDKNLSKELGSRGRQRVVDNFTWDAVARRFHENMSRVN